MLGMEKTGSVRTHSPGLKTFCYWEGLEEADEPNGTTNINLGKSLTGARTTRGKGNGELRKPKEIRPISLVVPEQPSKLIGNYLKKVRCLKS